VGPEPLLWVIAGYWIVESQQETFLHWPSREAAARFVRECADLCWQTAVLVGLWRISESVSRALTGTDWAGLALTMAASYGFSLLRRRSQASQEASFYALVLLVVAAQQTMGSLTGLSLAWGLLTLLGGSAACALIFIGVKERLRWTPSHYDSQKGPAIAFFCLGLISVILWSMGF